MYGPRILVIGKGGAGSWQIRGEQLGRAIGADVRTHDAAEAMKQADIVVFVKRIDPYLWDRARALGKFVVWDTVDVWPQPACNQHAQAMRFMACSLEGMRPDFVVFSTRRMHEDLGNGVKSSFLYHHSRPNQQVNPIRPRIEAIGYEGSERYIMRWRPIIDRECAKRGWTFVVNPEELADVDVILALRGGDWKGYAPQHWKSNVKLANAQATGTPIIANKECGYFETDHSGGVYFAENEFELVACFDWLVEYQTRRECSARLLRDAPNYTLSKVSQDYKRMLLDAYADR
jgi:glycosyltransferase involved in cell wall biosynthesis